MEFPINTNGMIFITIGWGFVVTLFVWCLYRVYKSGTELESSE